MDHTWSTPERLRGEVLTTRRYTNLRLPLPLPFTLQIYHTCSLHFKNQLDLLSRFDTDYECDRQTDGQNCHVAHTALAHNAPNDKTVPCWFWFKKAGAWAATGKVGDATTDSRSVSQMINRCFYIHGRIRLLGVQTGASVDECRQWVSCRIRMMQYL